MTYFPEIGHIVTIIRGGYRGKQAVVKSIDNSEANPIYVVENSAEIQFAYWVSPYDLQRVYGEKNNTEIDGLSGAAAAAAAAFDVANGLSGVKPETAPVQPATNLISGTPVDARRISFEPPVRAVVGRKIASAKTIDQFPVSAWRQAVAESLTYRGYTSWIDAIENGEDES